MKERVIKESISYFLDTVKEIKHDAKRKVDRAEALHDTLVDKHFIPLDAGVDIDVYLLKKDIERTLHFSPGLVDDIVDWLDNVAGGLLDSTKQALLGGFKWLSKKVTDVIDTFHTSVANWLDYLSTTVDTGFGWVEDKIDSVVTALETTIDTALGNIKGALSDVYDGLTHLGTVITQRLSDIFDLSPTEIFEKQVALGDMFTEERLDDLLETWKPEGA